MAEAGQAEPLPAFTETPQLPISHQFSIIRETRERREKAADRMDGSRSFTPGEAQVLYV